MIPPNTLFISPQPNQINPTLDSYHRSLDSLQLCLHLAVHLIWSPRGMAEPDSLTTFLWYVFIEPRCAGGINRASWFSITGGPTIRHHLRWNATDKVKTIENGKKGCVGWVVLAEVTQGWPTASRAIFLAASRLLARSRVRIDVPLWVPSLGDFYSETMNNKRQQRLWYVCAWI